MAMTTTAVRYHETVALQDVSLDLHRGEAVAVMGRNGAGKSTLLGLLTGTVAVARGRVTVLSEDPATLSGPALTPRAGSREMKTYSRVSGPRACRACRAGTGRRPGTPRRRR